MPALNYFSNYFDHLHNRLQTANTEDLIQAAQLALTANQQSEKSSAWEMEEVQRWLYDRRFYESNRDASDQLQQSVC